MRTADGNTVLERPEEANSFLAAIVESSADAIIGQDVDGIITFWNKGAERLLDFHAEEALGRSIYILIPPELLHAETRLLDRVNRGESIEPFDTVRLRKDGTRVDVSLTFSPIKDTAGRIIGASEIMRDITARKAAERHLHRRSQELNSFLETAQIGLHRVGPDGTILWANAAEMELLGYTPEEYIGHNIAEFHADETAINEVLGTLGRGDKLYEYEARLKCKDGSIKPVIIDSSVLWENGRFIHTQCFTRDITRRKQAEEALRDSEQRFRTLADNIAQLAWMADQTGAIFWINKRWIDFTGTTLEDVQGWGWQMLHHPDHIERVVTKISHAVDTGQNWEDTFPVRGKDGTYRWFLSRGAPIRNERQQVVRWLGTSTDVTDQLEAEKALAAQRDRAEESERLFRAFVTASSDTVYRMSADWTEMRRLEGKAFIADTLDPSRTWLQKYIHPDDQARVLAAINEAIREKSTFELEHRVILVDGTLGWTFSRAIPLLDDRGEIIEWFGAAHDITKRKRAEETLRESEERFRTLADNIAQFAWMADENGWIFWYNKRWFEYTGTTLEEMQGWGWQKVHHPDHVDRVVKRIRQSFETGQYWEDTFPLRGRDGTYKWFLSRALPIRNEQGKVVRWFGTNTDITRERETEQRLREQARLLNLSFDAIIVRDWNQRITFWNRGAEQLYGWSAEEALGQVCRVLLKAEFSEPFDQIEAKLQRDGRWEGEIVHSTRDGSRITVISRWALDRDAAGNPVGALETNNDITARRKAEIELREAREQLARRAADLEQAVDARTADLRATIAELEGVSYSLSHDMRAPLRTIQSFSEIVLAEAGENLTPMARELLQKSISAAQRLDRLIRDVLIYSRVSRESIEFSNVDVDHLIRQIIDERPEFQKPRAEIRIESPLKRVRGHEAYLTQCITNLLDNAVKFVAPGRKPEVRIWSEPVNGQVRLWFEDNGIGIAKEAQQRVFGIFERVHAQSAYPGTGIGLAIVRKAIARMGGLVGLESEPGKGSRFWMQLPAGD